MVTSQKNDILLLVTTRLIAHSGQSQFFPNCVGEFSTDTGYPLVTSKELSNCSGDQHKAYYTYIHTKVHTFCYMLHMGNGENFWSTSKCIFCYQKDCTRSRTVSVHSCVSNFLRRRPCWCRRERGVTDTYVTSGKYKMARAGRRDTYLNT